MREQRSCTHSHWSIHFHSMLELPARHCTVTRQRVYSRVQMPLASRVAAANGVP